METEFFEFWTPQLEDLSSSTWNIYFSEQWTLKQISQNRFAMAIAKLNGHMLNLVNV